MVIYIYFIIFMFVGIYLGSLLVNNLHEREMQKIREETDKNVENLQNNLQEIRKRGEEMFYTVLPSQEGGLNLGFINIKLNKILPECKCGNRLTSYDKDDETTVFCDVCKYVNTFHVYDNCEEITEEIKMAFAKYKE